MHVSVSNEIISCLFVNHHDHASLLADRAHTSVHHYYSVKKKMHSDILAIQTVCQCLDDSRIAGMQCHQERSEVLQQTIAGLRQQCKEQSKVQFCEDILCRQTIGYSMLT